MVCRSVESPGPEDVYENAEACALLDRLSVVRERFPAKVQSNECVAWSDLVCTGVIIVLMIPVMVQYNFASSFSETRCPRIMS